MRMIRRRGIASACAQASSDKCSTGVQSELVSHCERLASCFAILDMPLASKEVTELQEFRKNVDSSYAAMYHPWLRCYDPLANRSVYFPPSGSMAGIYGRTDNSRGIHKAPANEALTDSSIKINSLLTLTYFQLPSLEQVLAPIPGFPIPESTGSD